MEIPRRLPYAVRACPSKSPRSKTPNFATRPSGSTPRRRANGSSLAARRGGARSSPSWTACLPRQPRLGRLLLRGQLADRGPDRVLDAVQKHELELRPRLGRPVLEVFLVAPRQH